MSNDTGSLPGGDAFEPGPEDLEWVYALVNVWAAEEWSRVGEVALFDTLGTAISVGRDADSPRGHRRARWVRQRPGENGVTSPLASKATSRDQLIVTARVYGLDIEGVGKHPLIVDGQRVERCRVEEGAFVQVLGQFLFRCIRRPLRMPPLRHLAVKHIGPFGEANAFGMVGETPEMWKLLEQLAFAAKVPAHVLLRGQTGAGKESAAEAIHWMGPNASGPFVSMSVGNIARSLLEDELFGHIKGHPQPNMAAKKGVIGESNGGTTFLDELADLPFDAQTALLRVLDKGEYRTLGGDRTLTSVFKLVGAMNRELEALKLDLRKRLSTQIWLPTLAMRRDDVPLIVRHLLRRVHARAPDLTQHLVTAQADGTEEVVPPVWFVEKLMRREAYEGNVRDLLAAVNGLLEKGAGASEKAWERTQSDAALAAVSASKGAGAREGVGERQGAGGEGAGVGAAGAGAADDARGARLTKDEVEWCLGKTGGNVSAAAKAAGVSRPAFYRAMKRVGVKRGMAE